MDARARGAQSSAQLPGNGATPRAVHRPDGIHPRRIPSGDGASVLWLLGISDDRLFRTDISLRHPSGLHVSGRLPAPARHRRDPRLGTLALSFRRARPRLLRWHTSLRARRLAPGISSGLEDAHLQLWTARGSQLPHVERDVLVRQVPRRRIARGCRRFHALPRLLPQTGRMDCQQVWRARKPRGHRLPPTVQSGSLQRTPGYSDHRRRVDLMADGLKARLRWRPWLWRKVGYGLDARHPQVFSERSDSPQVSAQSAYVSDAV